MVVQRNGSLVVIVKSRQHRSHDLADGVRNIVIQDYAVAHLHSSVGDRSRFVQTQYVYSCQHFE